jgi:hypothetical protein
VGGPTPFRGVLAPAPRPDQPSMIYPHCSRAIETELPTDRGRLPRRDLGRRPDQRPRLAVHRKRRIRNPVRTLAASAPASPPLERALRAHRRVLVDLAQRFQNSPTPLHARQGSSRNPREAADARMSGRLRAVFDGLPRLPISQLIWPPFCQAPNHQRPAEAGLSLGPEGGGQPGARRAVRLICAGWLPQDRVSSQRPLSRTERRRGAAAHS